MLAGLSGTEAGRAEHAIGAGGDRTVELDRLAEEAVLSTLAGLAATGERFSVLSEEAGRVDHGRDFPLVLVDPVDGSLNAKQGLPLFGVMLCVLEGPLVSDALAGCVLNLAAGERFTAVRDRGAWRDGAPLVPMRPASLDRLEVLGLESSPRNIERAAPLIAIAAKLRLFGSMALSLAHTATGGIDVHASTIDARVFDMAASALILREVGGVVTDLEGHPLGGLEAGLTSRSTLLSSASPDLHALALRTLRG